MDDLKEKRFGKLIVKEFSHVNKRRDYWYVKCDCGIEKLACGVDMKKGHTISCGCFHKNKWITHNMTYTRFYNIWRGIKHRCVHDKGCYKGITICEKWKKFENFKEDMYNSYINHVNEFGKKNTTIDRIDNKLGYFKDNCRWATRGEQNRNMSSNVYLTHNNLTMCVADWAKRINCDPRVIQKRLKRGWTVDEALSIGLFPKGFSRYSLNI